MQFGNGIVRSLSNTNQFISLITVSTPFKLLQRGVINTDLSAYLENTHNPYRTEISSFTGYSRLIKNTAYMRKY